jgi:hypothetical protein
MKILLRKSLSTYFTSYLLKNARVVNPDLSFTSDLLL